MKERLLKFMKFVKSLFVSLFSLLFGKKSAYSAVHNISTKHSYHPNLNCSIAYKASCRRSQSKRRKRERRLGKK